MTSLGFTGWGAVDQLAKTAGRGHVLAAGGF